MVCIYFFLVSYYVGDFVIVIYSIKTVSRDYSMYLINYLNITLTNQ